MQHKENNAMQAKHMARGLMICLFLLGTAVSASAFGTDKFQDEVVKEKEAVTLSRETQQGGYGLF